MRNFFRKVFGDEKTNSDKEKTEKRIERTIQKKSAENTQKQVESNYSIDEVIRGITFQTATSTTYDTTNFELEDELLDKRGF